MQSRNDIKIKDHGTGRVDLTIDRANKHNALSRSVLAELAAAVVMYGQRSDTRLIVVKGAGDRYFAAGGDLVDLSSVRSSEATVAMSNDARQALDSIRNCEVPVIACLNGNAIGGGAELALACDMRVIVPAARIGFIQAKLAITPAWGGGTDLCALVGASRALRMMARCEMIAAEQALQWGLVDAIIHDGPDGTDMQQFLLPMLEHSGLIMRCLKRQTRAWRMGSSYSDRREAEQQDLVTTWTHDDHWKAAEKILSKAKQ